MSVTTVGSGAGFTGSFIFGDPPVTGLQQLIQAVASFGGASGSSGSAILPPQQGENNPSVTLVAHA